MVREPWQHCLGPPSPAASLDWPVLLASLCFPQRQVSVTCNQYVQVLVQFWSQNLFAVKQYLVQRLTSLYPHILIFWARHQAACQGHQCKARAVLPQLLTAWELELVESQDTSHSKDGKSCNKDGKCCHGAASKALWEYRVGGRSLGKIE